jgi:hypothetical protein
MAIVDQMDVHGQLVYNKSNDTGAPGSGAVVADE